MGIEDVKCDICGETKSPIETRIHCGRRWCDDCYERFEDEQETRHWPRDEGE